MYLCPKILIQFLNQRQQIKYMNVIEKMNHGIDFILHAVYR